MGELPTDAAPRWTVVAVAGDSVAGLVEAAEPLDVDVDHVTGEVASLAAHGFGWLKVTDAAEPGATQGPADGGGPFCCSWRAGAFGSRTIRTSGGRHRKPMTDLGEDDPTPPALRQRLKRFAQVVSGP